MLAATQDGGTCAVNPGSSTHPPPVRGTYVSVVQKKQLHLSFLVGICYLSPKPPFCKGGLFTLAFSRWPLAISKDYRVQRTEYREQSQWLKANFVVRVVHLQRRD